MTEMARDDRDPSDMSNNVEAEDRALKPSLTRRFRRIVFGILLGYLTIVIMLGFLQRSLIYQPYRQAEIRAEDSGLSAADVFDVSVTCDDQLQLRGWYLSATLGASADISTTNSQAAESADDKLLVLFFSGNAGNRQYRAGNCQVFTRLGADVLLIDYRGYGDNPGSPTEEHLAADAHAIYRYAATIRQVDPRRIVLFGESLGGGVATRLASELCEAGTPPAGLMLCSTFSSLTDAAAYHYPWLPVRYLLVDRFESVERIPQLTCPLLHIHGARDQIIPMSMGRRLFDAAPEHSLKGIRKRFVELPAVGHNDVFSNAHTEFSDAVGLFFATIGEKAAPAKNRGRMTR